MIPYTPGGHVLVSLDAAVVEDSATLNAAVHLLSAPTPARTLAKVRASLNTRAGRYRLEVTQNDGGLRFSKDATES